MFVLYRKEINGFFSTLTGYIVVGVFLIATSAFMWIFPGNYNIPDSGYANLDSLFTIAPWLFMFLVPAITMRLFSEEKRIGTIETLLTRPLSDLQIIFAKYLAGLTLVVLSVLPTLVYFYSVYVLGDPVGSIDTGGTWGSYIGLIFLGSVYVAIGIFTSSLTNNQIIAFILAVVIIFIFYLGFGYIADLGLFNPFDDIFLNLSITEHYESMSRGVLDSKDIIYFLAVNAAFIAFTRTVLESRNW